VAPSKFDKDKDYLIAKAWIKATTDPKFGTWQKGNTFFKTLYTHFTGWVSHVNSRICPGEIPMPEGCTINAIKQRSFRKEQTRSLLFAPGIQSDLAKIMQNGKKGVFQWHR